MVMIGKESTKLRRVVFCLAPGVTVPQLCYIHYDIHMDTATVIKSWDYLRVWHCLPVKPWVQWHMYVWWARSSRHTPPFLHGRLWHNSSATNMLFFANHTYRIHSRVCSSAIQSFSLAITRMDTVCVLVHIAYV